MPGNPCRANSIPKCYRWAWEAQKGESPPNLKGKHLEYAEQQKEALPQQRGSQRPSFERNTRTTLVHLPLLPPNKQLVKKLEKSSLSLKTAHPWRNQDDTNLEASLPLAITVLEGAIHSSRGDHGLSVTGDHIF